MCFFLFFLHSFAGGVLGLLFTRPSPTGSRGGTTRDPPPQDAAEAAGGSANGGGADAQGVSALPSQYAEATPPRMQRRPSQAAVWAALPRTPSGSWSTWRIGQTGKLLRGPMFTPISPIRHAPFFSYVSLGAFFSERQVVAFSSLVFSKMSSHATLSACILLTALRAQISQCRLRDFKGERLACAGLAPPLEEQIGPLIKQLID